MKSFNPLQRMRLWIALSEGPALWVAILGTIVVTGGAMALLLFLRTATGAAVDQSATIIGMGNSLSETGNVPHATIRMSDGVVVTSTLERTHRCRPGDIVTVKVEPQRWGISRLIRRRGCNA